MKFRFSTVFSLVALMIVSICFSCSDSNETANQKNNANVSSVNKSATNDFTNRPVNLNNPKEKVKFDKLIEELNKNRDLWKSQNITNYDYFCEYFNGGTYVFNPALIKVRENKTFSVEEIVKSEFHKHFELKGISPFEEMFNTIQKELEMGCSVNVKYNKKYGYIENWWAECILATDTFATIKISKFEIR